MLSPTLLHAVSIWENADNFAISSGNSERKSLGNFASSPSSSVALDALRKASQSDSDCKTATNALALVRRVVSRALYTAGLALASSSHSGSVNLVWLRPSSRPVRMASKEALALSFTVAIASSLSQNFAFFAGLSSAGSWPSAPELGWAPSPSPAEADALENAPGERGDLNFPYCSSKNLYTVNALFSASSLSSEPGLSFLFTIW